MLPKTSHRAEFESVTQWLFGSAIPFWISNGIDPEGFAYEELDFAGKPKEVGYRRSLVQFRQVYALARSAIMGCGSEGLPAELFSRTTSATWHKDGGFIHKLKVGGGLGDGSRDTYDQAFGMLASGWVYEIAQDSVALDYAYRTLRFLDNEMANPHGGYSEATNVRLPRRQNPHMHLFEAFLVLFEVTGDSVFRNRAEMILELLEQRFVTDSGALRENFDEDWRPISGRIGDVTEPGHYYEWVWLLHEYARLTRESVHPLSSALFDFADSYGLNASGLPVEQLHVDGSQLQGSVKLWAVTEQLKARIVRAEVAGLDFDPKIAIIVSNLSRNFLLEWPPVWFEEISTQGVPSRRRMPASTLYHILLAGTELLRWYWGTGSPLSLRDCL
jgi:mannose/cellobiose epimerase-like protein (N-acyl-D-glucosamine 2-epimerase family)